MVRLKGRPGAPENSVEFQFHNGTIINTTNEKDKN